MKHFSFPFALLLLAAVRLGAQGICDSTISIAPIPPICEGTGFHYLQVSHHGGDFSGPGITYSFSSTLKVGTLSPGFYGITYTITGPGGCTVSDTETFEVRDAVEAFTWASGKIDCSDPSSTSSLEAFVPMGNFFEGSWEGPPGLDFFEYGDFTTTPFAGEHSFMAYSADFGQCPAYGSAVVGFKNQDLDINIVSCTDCQSSGVPRFSLKIDTIPLGWHNFLSHNGVRRSDGDCYTLYNSGDAGLWQAEVINPANGCRSSSDALNFSSITGADPNVNPGTYIGLACGTIAYLNGGVTQGAFVDFLWTTPNGHFVGSSHNLNTPIDQPGMYILTGFNTFTGCSNTDTTYVFPSTFIPSATKIEVVCDGESVNGHSQTGNYVDTILQANGCPKIQRLKLIVLAPLLDSVEISLDNGQMNGSIQHFVTQGWPPYSYQWSNGEFSSSIFNLSAGTYSLTVTDANACEHIREFVVPAGKPLQHTGGDRTSAPSLRARLFPNPTRAGQMVCSLEIFSTEVGGATLVFSDVLGRSIFVRDIQIEHGENVFPISETLPPGVYSVQVLGAFQMKALVKLVVN